MIANRLMVGTLLALVAGIIVGVCAHRADARKRPRLEYAIVECGLWPWVGDFAIDTELRQLSKRTRGKRLHVVFRVLKRKIRASLQARLLGTIAGRKVWSVRGPVKLRAALLAAGCSVAPYSQAMSLPPAKLAWVKERSTCVGEATRKSKTITVWPCGQAGTTEIRLDGLAPRVLYGGNAFAAAGVEP